MTGDTRKTVIVTGASSGIGAAVARQAAQDGWCVLAGYATGSDRIASLVSEIDAEGGQAFPVSIPLNDPKAVVDTVGRLVAEGRSPEAVVLSASPPFTTGSFIKVTPEEFARQFGVAVVGNHALISALWKNCFRKGRDGHIVAVLSAALGPPPTPQMTPYITAKSALRTLLQCACAEYGRAGLRVSTLSPGFTQTPMLGGFNDLLLDMARSQTELGRFLEPEEVAAAIVGALAAPPAAGEMVDVEIKASMQ